LPDNPEGALPELRDTTLDRGLVPDAEDAAARRAVRVVRARRRGLSLALQLATIVVLAVVWQVMADAGWINSLFTSKPTAIVSAFYNGFADGSFWSPLLTTLEETLAGFAISVVLGVSMALVSYWVPLFHEATSGLVTAANNLPRLALAPLFVLWFGIGSESRIVLVVSLAFFVVLINTYAGLQNADRDHLLLARVLGAGRWKTFVTFTLPAATTTIFAGLRLALAFAFVGAVIGEIIMGGTGLGAQLVIFQDAYRTADVMALLAVMAIVATAMTALVDLLERRLLRWRAHEFRSLG
jgi:NitT/TauT family transport system permease protein